ncbi:MAG: SH3 domain-containing protein [Noviherbaspirillum sp.]
MTSATRKILTAALAVLAAGAASAVEFKSVGAAPAILYDAPSEKGRKVYIAPRGMPVEVVLTYGDWTKVRDAAGDLSWVESKALVARRSLVATVAGAKVRAQPGDSAPAVFTVAKGVLLELSEPASSGWIKVKHQDGQAGYILAAEVWGE